MRIQFFQFSKLLLCSRDTYYNLAATASRNDDGCDFSRRLGNEKKPCPINVFEPINVPIDETEKKSAPTNVSDPKNVFNKENEKKPWPMIVS